MTMIGCQEIRFLIMLPTTHLGRSDISSFNYTNPHCIVSVFALKLILYDVNSSLSGKLTRNSSVYFNGYFVRQT